MIINKNILKTIDIRLMCEKTGLSYNVIRNYMCGRKQTLDNEYNEKIIKYIANILNQ